MARGTAKKREIQRDALIDAAERRIAEAGLSALKARDLAAEVGCAVGALYSLVADMDEIVLRVGSRTLARLDVALGECGAATRAATPEDRLVAVALAYADFAADNLPLWRAMFEHRLAEGREVPDWSVREQMALFGHVDAPLRALLPDLAEAERHLLARALFSAVHGIVALGLEGKLVAVPREALARQIELVVRASARGLVGSRE
jgi:Bacterial regulatory proteins, tetR family.